MSPDLVPATFPHMWLLGISFSTTFAYEIETSVDAEPVRTALYTHAIDMWEWQKSSVLKKKKKKKILILILNN